MRPLLSGRSCQTFAQDVNPLENHRRVDVVPDEQAFEAIKGGIDALPPGVKMMLNSCTCIERRAALVLTEAYSGVLRHKLGHHQP